MYGIVLGVVGLLRCIIKGAKHGAQNVRGVHHSLL
jgi:hypothetical protein